MRRTLALLLFAPGCLIAVDRDPGVIVLDNAPPTVIDGYAGVYFDTYYGDDIWTFEVVADDPNGPLDIVQVWADVYDENRGGALIESFELYPTDDPTFWASDWYGSTTFLDPSYNGYTVDLIAYDTFQEFDWITVWADTY